ncbi:MAG: hypothetical protein LBP52_09185 [Burkholderiaceae bacterium]|jgi:hypothetical protein|nr:hypothetical protein [Burkholderiaceae bacterium]
MGLLEGLIYFLIFTGASIAWLALNAKYIAVAIFMFSICALLWTGSRRPLLKLGLVALLLGAAVLAMLYQPPPEYDLVSHAADKRMLDKRAQKAQAMCEQEARLQSVDPIPARGLTLEEARLYPDQLADMLLWQELAFVEAKVFADARGQGRIAAAEYEEEKNYWPVQQPPGQYVRLQLAAEGTPGCLAPSAMPEAVRKEWEGRYESGHGSKNAYLLNRERAEGKLCLWMGAIDASTASVRLDYAAYPDAPRSEPQGRMRLVDAQTGAVLAARTVSHLGNRYFEHSHCGSKLAALLKPENYQPPPKFDAASYEAEKQMFRNRAKKARAMCEQESRSRPVPVKTRAITLEEKGIHADELLELLLQKNLDFVEIKVFSDKNEWQGRIAPAESGEQNWEVDQAAGQYVRLQLAAQGTPGCLAPDAMPKGARQTWHRRHEDYPHFIDRERTQGAPLCLWLGNIDAPTAPVRLDYAAYPDIPRSEPQGRLRLVNVQTGATLAERTISNRGDRYEGCWGYGELTALLNAPATTAVKPPPQ